MNELMDRVKPIAEAARWWAEEKAQKDFAYDKDLMGLCAIASAKLFRDLQKESIPAQIHVWFGGHVFLTVEDYVVDITATQFPDFKTTPVVILHEREATAFEYFTSDKSFTSDDALRKYQQKSRWPAYQIAFTK